MHSDPQNGRFSRHSSRLNLALLALFSVLYFVLTITVAGRKSLQIDEFLTYHLARLPSISAIWAALSDGPDNSPPLNLLAVHAVYQVAGDGPVATRLSSILGIWVMSLCMYVFSARRCTPAYAWAAMLFPLTTQALSYAYDGRPYGLWMGFCGLALVCWQEAAANGRWRLFALGGLILSLAATISTHFYAPVCFISFGLAELARAWRRKRIDVLMGIALCAGLIPMAFYGPLIRNAKAVSGVFFSRPGGTASLLFYSWLLATSLPALVGAFAGLAADAALAAQRTDRSRLERGHFPPLEEVALALGFAGMPIFTMILSRLAAGGAFSERYALPAVIGLGVLVAFLPSYFERRATIGYVLAIALCGGAAFVGYTELQTIRYKNDQISKRLGKIQALKGLPIATDDPLLYFSLHYYCPPDFTSRLTYLIGPNEEHGDLLVEKLSPWVSRRNPFQIVEYRDFASAHSQFFFCFVERPGGRLIQQRVSLRRRFEAMDITEGFIFQASRAEGPDHSSAGEIRKTVGVVPR
jgi:hypothetical protein